MNFAELGSSNFQIFHTSMIRSNSENFMKICSVHHGGFGLVDMEDPQARMNFRKSSCNKYYYLFYKRYTKILFDQMQCAQKYIHNHRVYMYAFFYWCTHDFGHVYVDTYPLFFRYYFIKFSKCFWLL